MPQPIADGEVEEDQEYRPCYAVVFRYFFVLFLVAVFYYLVPDKAALLEAGNGSFPGTQRRDNAHTARHITLIQPKEYRPQRCVPVEHYQVQEFYAPLAERLAELATVRNYPLLTAAHVGKPGCMLVTRLFHPHGEYEALYNLRLLSTEGSVYVKDQNILCRRQQRKNVVSRLKFEFTNFTSEQTQSAACNTQECASQIFQAWHILNGSFVCSN